MITAETTDDDLLAAFVARDARAAEELYRRFAPRIYGLGRVMLGDGAASQDLVQDTFVKLCRTGDRFDPARGRPETWILLTARNLAIDSLRRRVLESRWLRAAPLPREEDGASDPSEIVEIGDRAARARQAMSALSPEQRAALELAYFGGKTGAEIAEIEGVPLGTAKTRIRDGLMKLRSTLGEDA